MEIFLNYTRNLHPLFRPSVGDPGSSLGSASAVVLLKLPVTAELPTLPLLIAFIYFTHCGTEKYDLVLSYMQETNTFYRPMDLATSSSALANRIDIAGKYSACDRAFKARQESP